MVTATITVTIAFELRVENLLFYQNAISRKTRDMNPRMRAYVAIF